MEPRPTAHRQTTARDIDDPQRPATFNLADLFDLVAAAVPERTALVVGERRCSYRGLQARAQRFGRWLVSSGIEPGARVGILAGNRIEWVEAMLGAFGAGAVPVNIDIRAPDDRIAHTLAHAEVAIIVHEPRFAPLVAQVARQAPSLQQCLALPGAPGGPNHATPPTYEDALAAMAPAPAKKAVTPATGDAIPATEAGQAAGEAGPATCGAAPAGPGRRGDDQYIYYSGVRRGVIRGVIWRQEDFFFAALYGGGVTGRPIAAPGQIVERMGSVSERLVSVVTAPLTHANGQWATLVALLGGGTAVFSTAPGFDPREVCRLVDQESCNTISIMGDRMARPLADVLSEAGDRYDTSSLLTISSGGADLSPEVRARLQALLPRTVVLDTLGSCLLGSAALGTGGARRRFAPNPGVTVVDDSLRPLTPGAATVGRVARRDHIPLGFVRDDATASLALRTDRRGVRWAVSGELATMAEDGTISLAPRE